MSSETPEGKLTAWERWELSSFDAPAPPIPQEASEAPAITLSTAEEIERLFQQARETGHAEGRAAGHAAGYSEGQVLARAEGARLAALTTQLEGALARFDQQVAEDLLALALDVARQVIRQALAVRPELLLEAVRESLTQMPHMHVTIHLHPEDASLVRSYLGDQLSHAGHRIHEDSRLERGDCLLESGGSQLDATLATRWRRSVESIGSNAEWLTPSTAETRGKKTPEVERQEAGRAPGEANADVKHAGGVE